jgi:hypothetical protein
MTLFLKTKIKSKKSPESSSSSKKNVSTSIDDVSKGKINPDTANTVTGKGTGNLSNTDRPLPATQTNGGRTIDVKTGQPLGGSGKARPVTVQHSSRKRAKDAARRDGKGTPVKQTKGKKGGNHYHAGAEKKVKKKTQKVMVIKQEK